VRNLAVLAFLFIIILTLSAINPVYCQDNEQNRKYCFSLGTGFGIIYGQSLELVYPVAGETKGELYSELIWDVKPVFYFGLHADFGLADIMSGIGFFSSLSFKAGIPGETGIMEDRDWKSAYNGALTNFSSHTNNTRKFFWLDINIGGSFPIKYLYIKPFLSGSWMQFAFTGSDGFYKYADEINGMYEPIENAPVISLNGYGDIISYHQDWLLLAAGLTAGTNILYPFSFEISFKITNLTYCASIDNHLLTEIDYFDFTSFGLFLEPKGSISFTVDRFKFSLEAAYRYISNTEGESYYTLYKKDAYLSPNRAGAGLSVLDIQFLFKFIL
jgi:hypothetical protein